MLPKNLHKNVLARKNCNTFRKLIATTTPLSTDFYSNDYLGFASSPSIFNVTHTYLKKNKYQQNGATGSRLISGNHPIYSTLEKKLAAFYNTEAALIYNSGYTANLGFFSSIPQPNDIVLYDALSHASIRDGIQLSKAKNYKFKHNSLEDLERLCKTVKKENATIFIVTESVFSMDGNEAPLTQISKIALKYKALLVVDEAHAVGVIDKKGSVTKLNLDNTVFAKIITFGKALGCHGAAILTQTTIKEYLINFSRAFIYTTALTPHSLATILIAHQHLEHAEKEITKLQQNISFFKEKCSQLKIQEFFVSSNTAIQSCILPKNKALQIAAKLQEHNFMVKAILAPTVPKNQERIRFCIHNYNSKKEISKILNTLAVLIP